MEVRADDAFIDDIQLTRWFRYQKPFSSLRDIPANFLIHVLRLRGYEGELYRKPPKWIPVRHKNGEITMKFTDIY